MPLAVERWISYSAVNLVLPHIVLSLSFEADAWRIATRQLAYTLPNLVTSIPVTLYTTSIFTVVYANLKVSWNSTAPRSPRLFCAAPRS